MDRSKPDERIDNWPSRLTYLIDLNATTSWLPVCVHTKRVSRWAKGKSA